MQMASTTRVPTTPTVPRSTPAPARTVSAASERMPPTTGTAREMASLAAFTAAASADPAMAPLAVKYPTNTRSPPVSRKVMAPLMRAESFFSPSLPRAAWAQQAAT